MADKQISELSELLSFGGNELFVVQNGNTAMSAKAQVFLDFLNVVFSQTDIPNGKRVTISNPTSTVTFDLTNGEDGEPGDDGVSPTISVSDIAKTSEHPAGKRLTITDASGTHTVDLFNGADGTGAVTSVNGQTGAVTLTASSVHAEPENAVSSHNTNSSAHSTQFSAKEDKGKLKIGSTEYTVRTGTSGANGYITFVLS